ncbi:nesprin-1-like isoform X3 [Ostrea edulis]|uniref:nesprin-1-like isoform X3 n=1 Tax=Ostrea edulis TaxID=37623 RepID=UPI0024AFF557|nr:nesprin-1-like isoform X3 [Ostrea edulis]
MGNNISRLNCSKNKKRKKKKKKLSGDVDRHRDSLNSLHNKAGKLLPKISPNDRSLVEDSIRSADKKHGELQTKIDRTKNQFDVVSGNLSDIKAEVDKYLSWLTQQEQLLSEEVAAGKHVQNVELRLENLKVLCEEMQSKQATIGIVKGKVEDLMRDLPQSERDVVDQWVVEVYDQHHKVYSLATDQHKLLASSVRQREDFYYKLQQLYQWLQSKEKEACKFQSVHLASQDVEKQVERCRTLQNEIMGHKPQIEELQKRGKMLHVDCTPEEMAEIDNKLTDMNTRYSTLLNDLSTFHNHLRDSIAARKNFETDLHKNDKWCKETEMKCAIEPSLDSAVEVLEEQLSHYKGLQKTSKMFESLVKVIVETGQSFKPSLHEDEKYKLDQEIQNANENFQRCADLIQTRLQDLQTALSTRSETQERISKAINWIDNIEKKFKQLPKTSGFDLRDGEKILEQCEVIGETLSTYQPTVTQLNQESERLRCSGQSSDADCILNVTTKYEILQDQVAQQRKQFQKGLAVQQQYQTQNQKLKMYLSECKAELELVDSQELVQRITSLQVLKEKLQAAETLFMQVDTTLQQFVLENSEEDVAVLREEYKHLQDEAEILKKSAEKKLKHNKLIKKNCVEFEALIEEAASWLEQKEDTIANCGALDLDTAMMAPVVRKHRMIAKEAHEKLNRLKEKAQAEVAHYHKIEEDIPEHIMEKLEQINNLENTMMSAIAKKEQYLDAAQADRAQFENSMKQINDWLSGAESLTDSGYDTLEYENLKDTLMEHQDYFHEASMCQDEMEQVMEISERLLPTLDSNDTETLRQTLKQTNRRFNDVTTKSNRKQEMVELKIKEWKDYQTLVLSLNEQFGTLEEELAKTENFPLVSQSAVQDQLKITKDLLMKMEKIHPEMNDLHDKAHELERVGNPSSCAAISKLSSDVNQRWQELTRAAENKQMLLCNIDVQWEDFVTLSDSLEKVLLEVEETMPKVETEKYTTSELNIQLKNAKDISCTLKNSEQKVVALKKCAQNLRQILPTVEAEVHTQEKLFHVVEKVERIQNRIQEIQASLEDEVEDRENFHKGTTEALSWLREANVALITMDSGKTLSDVTERLEKQKVLELEFAVKMEQLKHMTQLQETKYISINKTLPLEMAHELQDIQELKTSVMEVMQSKEKELLQIQLDRQEVTAASKEVNSWLAKSELLLQEQIVNISDCRQRHQHLSVEFENFKPVIDHLRQRGSDLIQHSPDPQEKQAVQESLRCINQQWLNLQARFAKRGNDISEAERLFTDFQNTAQSIQDRLTSTRNVMNSAEGSGLKELLKLYVKLSKESDQNQNKVEYLRSIFKQMEPLCDTSKERNRLSRLNQERIKLHTEINDKLGLLEESKSHMEEYEKDVRNLTQWIDETRSQLLVKDSNSSLKEQLTRKERLLTDIEVQTRKAQEVLDQRGVSERPDYSLLAKMNDLQQEAEQRCEQLQDAVSQQEKFEAEVQSLTGAINEAKEKLLSSHVQATDMPTLKKQIYEHNALAAQVKSFEERLNKINERNEKLLEESAPGHSDQYNRLSDHDYRSSNSSLRTPVQSDTDHLDSGVFLSPTIASTTTSMYSANPHREAEKARKRSHFISSASQSSPRIVYEMAKQSSDTIHSIGSQESFDQPRLSLSQNEDNFSNLLSKQSENELNRSLSGSQKRKSRSPSPTALCDDELIRPKSKYNTPQMLSLGPRQSSPPRREHKMGMKPMKATLKFLDPMKSVSASVPNLLAAHHEPCSLERSASFDLKSRPLSVDQSAAAKDTSLADLNSSWNTLQLQLGAKEEQLRNALQSQKQYQQAVQEVTGRLDRIQHSISRELPVTADLDKHIGDFQQILHDFDGIKSDVAQLNEQGRKLVDTSDREGFKTLQSTLSMLSARVENLQTLADIKSNQLQNCLREKERHAIAKAAYRKDLIEIEDWIDEKEMQLSFVPLSSETPASLRESLENNQMLQEDVSKKLQLIPDLAVRCDRLCQMETSQNAKKLRSQLTNLQERLGTLKLAMIEKIGHIKNAIKESEKRKKEMDEYESSTQKLQSWVMDTKQMTLPSISVKSSISPDHAELQQRLKSDIADHKQLLKRISEEVPDLKPLSLEVSDLSNTEFDQRWEKLHREFAKKRQNLEELINKWDVKDPSMLSSGWHPHQHRKPHQVMDVKTKLKDLLSFWQQLQDQCEDRQLRLDNVLGFQQTYQEALENISSCLDHAERKLFHSDAEFYSGDMLKDNEVLQREIRSLQKDISAMEMMSKELLSSASPENQDIIKYSLKDLTDRVHMIELQAQSKGESLRNSYSLLKENKEELRNLKEELLELSKGLSKFDKSFPVDQHISTLQKMEAQIKKLECKFEDLKKEGEEISCQTPQRKPPSELQSINTKLTEIKQMIAERKEGILQSVSVQKQYEQMLKDFAEFLETANDKVKIETLSFNSQEELKKQLASHQEFFSDLEEHRAMLDNLAAQTNQSVRHKHINTHSRLNNQTQVLLDKASLFGQKLLRTAREWTEIHQNYQKLHQFMDDVENQIPKSMFEKETPETIQEKISVYEQLQRDLNGERPILFQFVDRARQLLHTVDCEPLEKDVSDIAEKYIKLNSEVSNALKSLESIGQQMEFFEKETSVLSSWITNAMEKISKIRKLSDRDQQSIGVIRSKVDKLLEFKKEMNQQEALMSKALQTGNHLAQSKSYNAKEARSKVDWILKNWNKVRDNVEEAETYLHQAQMNLMPSRQALNELTTWLDIMEIAVKTEKEKSKQSFADLGTSLRKFKDFNIELGSKQLTVDFVYQSALHTSAEELHSAGSSSQTDFAEKLGQANKRWQCLEQDIKQTLGNMELLHSKLQEFDREVGKIGDWFGEQEEKITKYHLIGHEVSVKQTLADCKILQEALKSKEDEINAVRKTGNQLMHLSYSAPKCQDHIQSSLNNLDAQLKKILSKVQELESVLDDFLGHWNAFNLELQKIIMVLSETDYCLKRYTKVGPDLKALKLQVEKLMNLCEKVEQCHPGLQRLVTIGNQLTEVCEFQAKTEIQKTMTEVQSRWKRMSTELKERLNMFEETLKQWEIYEEEYAQAKLWLDAKELLSWELLAKTEYSSSREECLEAAKTLIKDLDNFQSTVYLLYQLSDALTKNIDSTSIATITSHQSAIEHRLMILRQTTSKQVQALQDEISQKQGFHFQLKQVATHLNNVVKVLEKEEMNLSSDEQTMNDRLDELKNALVQMDDTAAQLDNLNDLGYRRTLSEQTSKELRDLNRLWVNTHLNLQERAKSLQDLLLLCKDFKTKCEMWMTFLRQMEMDLSTEIAGNLSDLQKQLKQCERFELNIITKQQILHSIIQDGEKMIKEGKVSQNEEDLPLKLHELVEQWHSVLRRATQRKAIIRDSIQQWRTFNESTAMLHNWLTENERILSDFDKDLVTIQGAKNNLEKLQSLQREIKDQEASFQKIHEQGRSLLQHSDKRAKEEASEKIGSLQTLCNGLVNSVESKCANLKGTLQQWQECEKKVEDICLWLKDIRTVLSTELPNEYDKLGAEYQKCMDIEASFQVSEMQRQVLQEMELRFSNVIQPDDLNILHKRILLLNKQWDELYNQASQRRMHIQSSLSQWANFSDNVLSFHKWIDEMEYRIIISKEYHIEDLLQKFSKEFREDMLTKELWKDKVIKEGRELLKISSDAQFSDVQTKIRKTEDKWNHLKNTFKFRKRKLEETLLAVKQLDTSMANLRKWLANIEHDLCTPLFFMESDDTEVKAKLQCQKELQKDVELHSAGVGSVLNLCEVLLHDSDACPTEVEFSALQSAMKNLDRRWRQICQICPERRIWIEETWNIWEKVRTDCSYFENWLHDTELEVQASASDDVHAGFSKTEVEHLEQLQREIHGKFGELEQINEVYRKLAREGRTDHAGALKLMIQTCNQKWDILQKQVSDIATSLKQLSTIHEEFKSRKDLMYKWLTDVEVRVTDLEYLSLMDVPTKVAEIKRLQNEMNIKNTNMDDIDSLALLLMEKECLNNTTKIQKETEELKSYFTVVLDRVSQYSEKLETTNAQVEDPNVELDILELQLKSQMEFSTALITDKLHEVEEDIGSSLPLESPPEKRRAISQGDRNMSNSPRTQRHRTDNSRSTTPSRISFSPTPVDSLSPSRSRPSSSRATKEVQLPECTNDAMLQRNVTQTQKNFKLLQHERELNQFIADVDNMLTWLHEVKGNQSKLQSSQGKISSLDFIIKHHRDFLMQLELKKARVQSLNLLGKDFIDIRTEKGRRLHDRLREVNFHWDELCSKANILQRELQEALMQCQEFHHTIHDLLLWLESVENKIQQCEPIKLTVDETAMWSKLRNLKGLKADLENNKEKICSLRETADQLLINTESVDMTTIRDKMHIIANRQNALVKLCSSYIANMEDILQVPKPSIAEFNTTR